MTNWTEMGRKRAQIYFLTIYLKEAYTLYLESCEKDDDKCSFSTFCKFSPKNVLLLDEFPKQQYKYQIHNFFFLCWRLWASTMKKIGGTQCCALRLQIMTAGKARARNVLMVKKMSLPRA